MVDATHETQLPYLVHKLIGHILSDKSIWVKKLVWETPPKTHIHIAPITNPTFHGIGIWHVSKTHNKVSTINEKPISGQLQRTSKKSIKRKSSLTAHRFISRLKHILTINNWNKNKKKTIWKTNPEEDFKQKKRKWTVPEVSLETLPPSIRWWKPTRLISAIPLYHSHLLLRTKKTLSFSESRPSQQSLSSRNTNCSNRNTTIKP